jgi:hypothetical protein
VCVNTYKEGDDQQVVQNKLRGSYLLIKKKCMDGETKNTQRELLGGTGDQASSTIHVVEEMLLIIPLLSIAFSAAGGLICTRGHELF